MKLNQHNKFVRFILRAVDLIAAFYSRRLSQVRWDQDPYQKATKSQKRESALFIALFPIAGLFFFGNLKYFDSWVDSMIYGHHSIIWFYLAFTGIVCLAVFFFPVIAQKIPLFISVPPAIVAWPIFLWYGWNHLF